MSTYRKHLVTTFIIAQASEPVSDALHENENSVCGPAIDFIQEDFSTSAIVLWPSWHCCSGWSSLELTKSQRYIAFWHTESRRSAHAMTPRGKRIELFHMLQSHLCRPVTFWYSWPKAPTESDTAVCTRAKHRAGLFDSANRDPSFLLRAFTLPWLLPI